MSSRMPLETAEPDAELPALSLELVRPAFARAAQGIAGRHRPVNFSWNGQAATLQFSGQKTGNPARWTARVTVDGHELKLRLERLPDVSALSAALAGIDLEALPAELACGVLSAAFEGGLNQLKGKGVDVTLVELQPLSPPAVEPLESIAWLVAKEGNPGWMRGTLEGPDTALEHLAKRMSQVPALPLRTMETLPVGLSFVIGRTRLSQRELGALRLADAVLADLQTWRTQSLCEVLVSGRRHATATLQGTTLTIQQMIMSEPSPTPAVSEPLTSVDQLEVELTFLVGTHTATLEQVRSLAPGACLELGTPVGQAVTVCANGRPIGRGELLDIGSRIGVRITELASS